MVTTEWFCSDEEYGTKSKRVTKVCDGCGKTETSVLHGCQAMTGSSGGWWCECGAMNTYGQFAKDVGEKMGKKDEGATGGNR